MRSFDQRDVIGASSWSCARLHTLSCKALRDEGTSYHYLPAAGAVAPIGCRPAASVR